MKEPIPIDPQLLSDEWLDEARADAEMNHEFSVADVRRLFGHIAALTIAIGARAAVKP